MRAFFLKKKKTINIVKENYKRKTDKLKNAYKLKTSFVIERQKIKPQKSFILLFSKEFLQFGYE